MLKDLQDSKSWRESFWRREMCTRESRLLIEEDGKGDEERRSREMEGKA